MSRRVLIQVCSAQMALAAVMGTTIDFTPTVLEYSAEGFKYAKVEFKDDKRVVSMNIPSGWACRGATDRLQLIPPNTQSLVEGSISAIPLNAPQPFTEATAKAFKEQVVSSLPPGSNGVAIVTEMQNSVVLGSNPSFEVLVSYDALGKKFRRSVVIVNCPERQLVFRFTAPMPEFDPLNAAFRQSISSWHWLEPRN